MALPLPTIIPFLSWAGVATPPFGEGPGCPGCFGANILIYLMDQDGNVLEDSNGNPLTEAQ